jgi:DNA-directed RNA polymerase subunit RPC12/RpoP
VGKGVVVAVEHGERRRACWQDPATRLDDVSFLRGFDGSEGARPEPVARGPGIQEERRATRTTLVAIGTLACTHCDAPVAPGPKPMAPSDPLECPYCEHRGTVRDFLSLKAPPRPARVAIRIARSAHT